MAEEKQRDGERQSDLAVMDANEYKQKRRLERILDALDGVQDTADEAWENYVKGEIDGDALNITIQRAVKNAIRECSVLLKHHHKDTDGRERYWAGRPSNPIGILPLPNGEEKKIVGLSDFLNSNAYYDITVERSIPRRNKPDKKIVETAECTLPVRVSYNGSVRLKEFLEDVHDMEISFEELENNLQNKKPTKVAAREGAELETVIENANTHVDDRAVGDNAN